MGDFQAQFDWQMQYLPMVEHKIRNYGGYFLRLQIAPEELDKYEGTDMLLRASGAEDRWAVRLRKPEAVDRPGRRYRDLTIRSTGVGMATELDKLRGETCPIQWYFYGWIDSRQRMDEFVIVDVTMAWDCGVFDVERPEIPNGDGTRFIAIPLRELRQHNALLVSHVRDDNGNMRTLHRRMKKDLSA